MVKELKEKKELLKREEIRTMSKDMNKLKEREAQKERERIASLEPASVPAFAKATADKEGIKTEKPLGPEKELVLGALIPRNLPKKPSHFEKIFIRVIIVIILILIVGFFYWYLGPRTEIKEEEKTEQKTETSEEQKEEGKEEKKEIIIPSALISIDETETLEISLLEETPGFFSQIIEKDLGENQFNRITIKNKEENRVFNLEDLFNIFEIKSPEGFLGKLNKDFTLFVYSSKGTNRLGFVAKIEEKENLSNLLKSWEPTMEQDFENLSLVLGKKGPAPINYFKDAFLQGKTFRYLSFLSANFGICWSILDDYFIFTYSGESIIKTINQLSY